MFITFSGLDGAGKTTLIQGLKQALEADGYKVTVLTMYDHIAFYSFIRRLRDGVKQLLKRSDVAPVQVSPVVSDSTLGVEYLQDPRLCVDDKSGTATKLFYRVVRSRTVRRLALFLDLMSLWLHRLIEEGVKRRILITDRYVYDSLADVADLRDHGWLFIRLFLFLVPIPDAPVFVDVPAEAAFARKQEYPVDYMKWRRTTYHKIFSWVPGSIVLVNDDLEVSQLTLERIARERLSTLLRTSRENG